MDEDFKAYHSFTQFTCQEHFIYLLRYEKKLLLWKAMKGLPILHMRVKNKFDDEIFFFIDFLFKQKKNYGVFWLSLVIARPR